MIGHSVADADNPLALAQVPHQATSSFPGYFGGSLACSMIVLFALPFTLGLGDPYWWAWIPVWAAVVAGFLWWYGWLPPGRTADVP